jgi:hypothetical protein
MSFLLVTLAANLCNCKPGIQYPILRCPDILQHLWYSFKAKKVGYGTRKWFDLLLNTHRYINDMLRTYLVLLKAVFSGLITTIKNVCSKASHFVISPKLSVKLYVLSALNTKVAKTAPAGFSPPLFSVFPKLQWATPSVLHTVYFDRFTRLVESHFCPGDSKLEDEIFYHKI